MNEKYYIEKSDPYFARILEEVHRSRLLFKIQYKEALPLNKWGEVCAGKQIAATIAPSPSGKPGFYCMIFGVNLGDQLREVHSLDVNLILKSYKAGSRISPYREDFERRRCVLPASFFIERRQRKANDGSVTLGAELAVQSKNANRTYLAGIYRIVDGLPHCLLLTAASEGEYLEDVSDHVPVVIPESLINEWIDPNGDPKDVLKHRLTEFVYEEYVLPEEPPTFW